MNTYLNFQTLYVHPLKDNELQITQISRTGGHNNCALAFERKTWRENYHHYM